MADNHKLYELALRDKHKYPVVAYGSAGTGKTYGAVAAACEGILKKEYKRIIVTRPNVSFADKNGYLPGTEREKMEPWIRPILQHMQGWVSREKAEEWESKRILQFYPLEYIQGMTFDNAFILVDECQNMTIEQLRVLLTRTGKYSKTVLCGDVAQVSPKFHNSGLKQLIAIINKFNLPVHQIEFSREDILRSEQCKMWIAAFEEWDMNA